jgi:oligoribonuclease NrnB/cAMP/cGMP phosphodiesterase (DHH superfamily)
MRIVTRADFDSVASAVLLYDALDIDRGIKWVEPGEIQKRTATIEPGDVIANLPFAEGCLLWFDHHYSNRIDVPFKGSYRVAPSAAGLIYEYYRHRFSRDFQELTEQADKIDSADLTYDEVLYPEKHPYLLLSMTIISHEKKDEPYWNQLVSLIWKNSIEDVMKNDRVAEKCRNTIQGNKEYKAYLENFTKMIGPLSVTDFRTLRRPPTGNRFLVYSLFPEAVVNMKIRYDTNSNDTVLVSVGHSIFNRNCYVNVGDMLSRFEGGGHAAAGACSFAARKADDYIPKIIDILVRNKPGGAD